MSNNLVPNNPAPLTKSPGNEMPSRANAPIDTQQRFDENEMLFTYAEMDFFRRSRPNIINYYDEDGTPFVDYNVAKAVFEHVVGINYDTRLLEKSYNSEFEVYEVTVALTIYRRGKKITKEAPGSAPAQRRGGGNKITNYKDMAKTAEKDAIRKILSDFFEIGAADLIAAKKIFHEQGGKKKKNNYNSDTQSNRANNQQSSVTSVKCEDCGYELPQNVLDYSKKRFNKALCIKCQKKY